MIGGHLRSTNKLGTADRFRGAAPAETGEDGSRAWEHWPFLVLRILLPVMLVALGVDGLSAQKPTIVDLEQEVLCQECTIRFELMATLEARGNLVVGSKVARLSDGRFVATTGDPSGIAIFDREGRYESTFGRRGRGPGEFTEVSDLKVSANGELYVVDSGDGRVGVLSEDLEHVRYVPSRGRPTSVGVASADTIVVAESLAEAISLSTIDQDSPLVFGRSQPENGFESYRTLAVSPSRMIWTARRDRYQLDGYSFAGDHLAVVQATELAWFPPGPGARDKRATIIALEPAGKRDVWVLIQRTKPGWRPLAQGAPVPNRGVQETLELFEFVFEIVDPHHGYRVMSAPIEGMQFGGFVGPAMPFSYEEDEVGAVSIKVWRAVPLTEH